MAHGTRINGTAYGITGGKCLVNGTVYGIKKGRTLVGGTGHDISFGTPLSAYSEGDIVKINENGYPVDFYVSKHDYENSLNGTGRTLVVRKAVYDIREWNSQNVNTWASCSMRSWLNSTYKALLDSNIQRLIATTSYYYTPGDRNITVSTRSDAVFLLSLTELGLHYFGANVEGTNLPISNELRLVFGESGSPSAQWTRSPYTYFAGSALFINQYEEASNKNCSLTNGSRPAFTLPSSTIVGEDGLIL